MTNQTNAETNPDRVDITLTGIDIPREAVVGFVQFAKNNIHKFSLYVTPHEELDDEDNK